MIRVAIESLLSVLLVAGGAFALIGAIGLVRLPDFLIRLPAPTTATTLGVGSVLLAALLYFLGIGRPVVHELLITLFLFVTAPVSALMLGRAALKLGLPSQARLP